MIDEHQNLVSKKTRQVQARTIQSTLQFTKRSEINIHQRTYFNESPRSIPPLVEKKRIHPILLFTRQLVVNAHQTLVSKKTPRLQIRTIHSILQFIKWSEINLLERTWDNYSSRRIPSQVEKKGMQPFLLFARQLVINAYQTLVSKKTLQVQVRTIHSILLFIKQSDINLLERT